MGFTSDSNIIHKSLESLSIQEYCSTFGGSSSYLIILYAQTNNKYTYINIFRYHKFVQDYS